MVCVLQFSHDHTSLFWMENRYQRKGISTFSYDMFGFTYRLHACCSVDYTVQTLVNITGYLALAKTINVAQFYLPSDVKDSIDKLNIDLNKASNTLGQKTHQNSRKIRTVCDVVYYSSHFSFTTADLSILGHKNAIHLFIIGGWLLVVVTLVLCEVFVILNTPYDSQLQERECSSEEVSMSNASLGEKNPLIKEFIKGVAIF
ncbi:hypothetical protein CTI12_AA604720 [Artemisia annua]|uniref:Uncharacterized protein n=1 Tax=Artemisia annua TaxID=35608 RepID=A0A2U1KGS7_ARTAN|nr:hypothetical protein CTI12_AA604720 [Artemisia annua]